MQPRRRPAVAAPRCLLDLQRLAGNAAVSQLIADGSLRSITMEGTQGAGLVTPAVDIVLGAAIATNDRGVVSRTMVEAAPRRAPRTGSIRMPRTEAHRLGAEVTLSPQHLVHLQRAAGNSAVCRMLSVGLQRGPTATGTPPSSATDNAAEKQLMDIQGHTMDALLRELKRLPAKTREDESLGQRVGGPRLVMAMRAVSAKNHGRPWTEFSAANQAAFQTWPPDQVVSILDFLGATGLAPLKQVVIGSLNDIVTNTQGDLPLTARGRKRLLGVIADEMFGFAIGARLVSDIVRDVRQRALASLYMQQTQKGTQTSKGLAKGFSYPNRKGDETLGVGPRVNEAARTFWGPVQGAQGTYFFNLSPAGKANAYEAIVTLFTEQVNPHLRTLIHCDYLVSVIEYRAWAETIGVEKFNQNVKLGNIPLVLKYNGFSDLTRTLTLSNAPTSRTVTPDEPLTLVEVSSESDLIIGDHVVFFNDPTYDALTQGDPDVWRLENAIVVDSARGQHLYQGHGYSSPVPKSVLMDAMCNKYNLHVDRTLALINKEKTAPTAATRTAAAAERKRLYPNVRPKVGGTGWEVAGHSDIADRDVARDLKFLTPAQAPGLKHPRDGAIWARRPKHIWR
jgi:hypothetical protein